MGTVLRHLRRAALREHGRDLTDAQLLDAFLARRYEAAFACADRNGERRASAR